MPRDKGDNSELVRKLEERVKELNTLYRVSNLVTKSDVDLFKTIKMIADVIPTGWQYPEICCSRIVLDGVTVTSSRFKEGQWKQEEKIFLHGEQRGSIEVHYLAERPDADEGPFLLEERNLLIELSKRISVYLRTIDSKKQLDSYKEMYGNLFRESDEGIAYFEADEGSNPSRFLFINKNAEPLLGRTHEVLLTLTVLDIVPSEGVGKLKGLLSDAVKSGAAHGTLELKHESKQTFGARCQFLKASLSGKEYILFIFGPRKSG